MDSLHVADGCSSTLSLQTPNEMRIPYFPLKHELQDRTALAQGNYNDFSTEIFLTKLTSSIKVQKGTHGKGINLLTQTVTVIEDFGIIFFTTALKKRKTHHITELLHRSVLFPLLNLELCNFFPPHRRETKQKFSPSVCGQALREAER